MFTPEPNFTERSRAILQELAEIGLGLAYRLGAEREPTGETALAYSRVAKAVRQTLAMESHVSDEQQKEQRAAAERQTKARETAERDAAIRARNVRYDETQDIIERLIEVEPPERREDLTDGLDEWLCDPDPETLFDPQRPLGELIASICKDLDLSPDWSAFADEPWAEAVRSGQPPQPPDFPLIPAQTGTQANRGAHPTVSDTS